MPSTASERASLSASDVLGNLGFMFQADQLHFLGVERRFVGRLVDLRPAWASTLPGGNIVVFGATASAAFCCSLASPRRCA